MEVNIWDICCLYTVLVCQNWLYFQLIGSESSRKKPTPLGGLKGEQGPSSGLVSEAFFEQIYYSMHILTKSIQPNTPSRLWVKLLSNNDEFVIPALINRPTRALGVWWGKSLTTMEWKPGTISRKPVASINKSVLSQKNVKIFLWLLVYGETWKKKKKKGAGNFQICLDHEIHYILWAIWALLFERSH